MNNFIELEKTYCANNYHPLPIVLSRGEGVYVWDTEDKRYLDVMSAYSALNLGHSHPHLIAVLTAQAQRLAVTSRAFYTDKLAPFLKLACELTGQDKAMPANTGVEAVEIALKAARKWGYTVKKIPEHQAEIIVCQNNFHGRTISVISMSSEPQYKFGFGPLTPGFKLIPYGDAAALRKAITANTAGFLIEPIQGEAGIIVPPAGYLTECARICREENVLLICDEIQTGLGRTGKLLASMHEQIKPDGLILGKALGGGLLPVSLFLSRHEVMDVFTPGDHGSTFGGNPLAAAVAIEALTLLAEETLIESVEKLGHDFLQQLQQLHTPLITEVRGQGLLIGLEINSQLASAREFCLQLIKHGVLSKETHEKVVRLAPPLIINTAQIDTILDAIEKVIYTLTRG